MICDFIVTGVYLATLFGVLRYSNGKVERIKTGQFTSSTVKSLAVVSEKLFWMSASEGVVKYEDGGYRDWETIGRAHV